MVSEGVQIFVILAIVLNLSVGLALTYDVREWPHRLQEIILYVIFLCECNLEIADRGRLDMTKRASRR